MKPQTSSKGHGDVLGGLLAAAVCKMFEAATRRIEPACHAAQVTRGSHAFTVLREGLRLRGMEYLAGASRQASQQLGPPSPPPHIK